LGKIPQIIHQIWLGSPIPELYAGWEQTWQKLNPGWDYRLWNEREIDAFGLVNRRAYDESTSYGVKSDLARYEILERLGGILTCPHE
jgi:mannosyltransferase OCH1-like enzyme